MIYTVQYLLTRISVWSLVALSNYSFPLMSTWAVPHYRPSPGFVLKQSVRDPGDTLPTLQPDPKKNNLDHKIKMKINSAILK